MSDTPQNRFDIYHGNGSLNTHAAKILTETHTPLGEEGAYLADDELIEAVNVALCVGQPLLVTGEPGCGKTRLAWSVADELGLGEPLQFFTRSSSRAQNLLYTYDSMGHFRDIQINKTETKIDTYITYEALGQAIKEGRPRVVLVDEIDKAPRDFPNDLLTELDRMQFEVREFPQHRRLIKSEVRPIMIITSNSERQLPLPFLRRCVFHHIAFPSEQKLKEIINQRLSSYHIDDNLISAAIDKFYQVRDIPKTSKRPATGEALTWLVALHTRGVLAAELVNATLAKLPLWQALLKDRDDYLRLQETRT